MESVSASVECECETMDKPVDFLGDSICKSSSSNVRDIIRRYEPDRELIETGSLGSFVTNPVTTQRSQTKSLNRVVFEETESKPMRVVAQQNVTKQVFTRSVEKPRGVVGNKRSLGALSKKSNVSNAPKRSHSDIRPPSPLTENTYKSKTTITRTAQGVRITTDILYNSNVNVPDQWVGRRIDTDLPQSKILLEFQSTNNSGK